MGSFFESMVNWITRANRIHLGSLHNILNTNKIIYDEGVVFVLKKEEKSREKRTLPDVEKLTRTERMKQKTKSRKQKNRTTYI